MSDDDKLVWSSEDGRVKQQSGSSRSRTRNDPDAPKTPSDGVVRISRQTKDRRGKTVTVITGLDLPATDLAKTASQLKKCCGVGGSAKDGVITIQGDKREVVAAELEKQGFQVMLSGGS